MAIHGTYDARSGRPVLRFDVRLERPPEQVWRALDEPGLAAGWFPTTLDGELRTGAPLAYAFDGDDRPAAHGTVLAADPPHHLQIDWFGDVLQFDLAPLEGGTATLLRFLHVLGEHDAAARTLAGWSVCLERLESGREHSAWQEHYDRYVAGGVPHGAPVPRQG